MTFSLPDLLERAGRSAPERAALLLPGSAVSHAQLWVGVGRWASWFRDRGLAEKTVGLLLPNSGAFPLALYGVTRAGGTALLLNPLCARREIGEYVRAAGARAVVAPAPLAHLLPDGAELLEPERIAAESAALSPPDDVASSERDAALIFTAASDGWARGARLTHANLIANLRSTVDAMGMTPDDRVLAALPLIHSFGLTVTLNAPLSIGAAVIPVERFHPMRVLELLERSGATVISGVPAMFAALAAVAGKRGAPRHQLRIAISGGAPLPLPVGEAWERGFGLPLRHGYGLTEAAPVCLFNRHDRPNHPGTLGWPFPGVEVSLRDSSGRSVPDGETGEICVAGPNVFPGYLGENGRQPADFHGDAFRTGDLGRWEADGTVCFAGLCKPMFTRNGFNVYSREVERALREDPRIEDASVSAVPDPDRENEVALAIRPAPGAILGEDKVRQICRERLAAYKQPGPITIHDA